MQQRIDVEALLQHRHPIGAASGGKTQFRHPGQEGVFVAEEPDAQCLAFEISRRRDAGFLKAGQHQARVFEGLGDVHQRQALFTGGQGGRHPVNDHIGAAASDHLLGRDVGAAGKDGHVQTLFLVIAFFLRDVIAGKLRLRHPFQLQLHAVICLRRGGQQAKCGSDQQFLHCLTSVVGAFGPVICVVRGARRSPPFRWPPQGHRKPNPTAPPPQSRPRPAARQAAPRRSRCESPRQGWESRSFQQR